VKFEYRVSCPLAVVQIDHTVADILLVDPEIHSVIGRPTLTLALDVATRCVLGFCVSLEPPSSLLVALCLETSVFPKDEWLRAAGLEATCDVPPP
jgi:putative transposase